MQITQIHIRAYPSHKLNYRAPRTGGMKEFVEGTAIKFTMIIDEPEATCTLTIDDPVQNVVVDTEGMTKEKDYVYSYVYQTVVSHFGKGAWLVTFKATLSGKTALTQDTFSLLDNRRLGNT